MSEKESSKKGKPTAKTMDFGRKPLAMTPLDKGPKVKMQTNDALKPVAMTPVPSAKEDRGVKPVPMTPAPARPAPAQPKK